MSVFAWSLSFLRPYRFRLAAIITLSVTEVLLAAMAPWPMKAIVDNVFGGQPFPSPLDRLAQSLTDGSVPALLVFVALAGFGLQLTLELVRATLTQVHVDTGQRIVYTLRARLLSHLQALPMSHHVLGKTGDSVYRLESDAYCVNDLIIGGIFPLATAALNLSVMFVILLQLDATLALLSLVVAPFLYVCLRYYSRTMTDRAERVKAKEANLLERAFEVMSSIAAVKSFARERYERERFDGIGAETMRARLRLTWQESLFSLWVTVITLSGTALVLIVGGLHVLDGTLTIGGLLVVIAYLAAVYGPLASIAHTTGSLQAARVSARRVRELLALAPEEADAPGSLDAGGVRGHIVFDNVRFAYDESRPILDGISFTAKPGELVALVGLTGAGKTTLVNLIPRFFTPSSGRVLIDNVDVRKYGLRSLRERVALVAQQPVLFSGTIADNIRYGRLDATDAEIEQAADVALVDSFVRRLPDGYQTTLGQAGATFSGGERQRLGIARAVLKDAPILILDEPTSALDAISEEAVFQALRRLRQGRTTLVIAHRLSTIRDATRILVLHEGRLVAQGTHDELIRSNDLYRRMCARLSVGQSLDEPESVDEVMKALA
ncbi:MAG: ABC transporter ATP-binding protein [Acidobacteria bacterium]|nr:ABC transporter ATP-binding protein [Acidobacteriota bacterium]